MGHECVLGAITLQLALHETTILGFEGFCGVPMGSQNYHSNQEKSTQLYKCSLSARRNRQSSQYSYPGSRKSIERAHSIMTFLTP
eukprot:2901423-Amphidinium_carterae.1